MPEWQTHWIALGRRLASLGLAFLLGLSALGSAVAASTEDPLRVVFVGNSYTYTNDLPMLFRALMRSQKPQRPVETEAFLMPGGFINERWREADVQQYLKHNKIDVLVLQEAGGWLRCADHPSLRTTFACTDSLRSHKRFAQFAAGLGVRTVILGTWGADAREQSAISRVTRRLSKAIDAVTADAGEAIVEMRKVDRDYEAFTDDILHPTVESSMLAAVMLYVAIEGWLPEAQEITTQKLLSVRSLPTARAPLSAQYDGLPKTAAVRFPKQRMEVLIAAAKRALDQHRE